MELILEHRDVEDSGPDGIAGPSGNACIFSCRPLFYMPSYALIQI